VSAVLNLWGPFLYSLLECGQVMKLQRDTWGWNFRHGASEDRRDTDIWSDYSAEK